MLDLGPDTCAPPCSVAAAAGATASCSHGTCRQISGDDGTCVIQCNPFENTGCPAGYACGAVSVLAAIPEQAAVTGQCMKPGSGTLGSLCIQGSCGPGLACGALESSFTYDPPAYACAPPCSSHHPCAGGLTCTRLFFDPGTDAGPGVDHDFGTCQNGCTNVGGACAGADAGAWCAPTNRTPGLGLCVVPGPSAAGQGCIFNADCAAGLFCDGASHLCRLLCTSIGSACPGGTCHAIDYVAYGSCD